MHRQLLCPVVMALGCLGFLPLGAQGNVNFSEHIAPIVYTHCTGCHRPGEVGPMPFTSYEEIRDWGPMIAYVTGIRYMPPWKADPTYQSYLRENLLTDTEIQQIADWVQAGMPQGDPALAPQTPIFPTGSQIGTPDLVLSFAQTHLHPGDGIDEYRYFVLPTGLTEERDLVALEVRPGNRRIVHHTLIWADTTGAAAQQDAETPEYGYQGGSGFGVNTEAFQNQLPGYVPGQRPPVMTNGMAMRLPPNADLLLQMHYAPSAIDEPDSSSVLLFFADQPAQRYIKTKIMIPFFGTLTNGPFIIPANQTREFHGTWTVPEKASVIGISPHMHLLGTHWEVFAINPAGDTLNLIRINDWDFNWQGTFGFQRPVILEEGSVIHAYAGYDNTTDNPFNPNNPPVLVRWGEGTSDEMYYLPINYVSYQEGDENLELDDALTSLESDGAFYVIQDKFYPLAPNPVGEQEALLGFSLAQGGLVSLQLHDLQGRLLKTYFQGLSFMPGQHSYPIQFSGLSAGAYVLSLFVDGRVMSQQIIKN